ncbi:MAG: prepilin-type N-terminal cleavage/methylation domain-containing protein [Eubacteriales bacterium]
MKNTNSRGFTIIELIVVIALIIVVIAIVTNIFLLSNKSFDTGVNMAEVQKEARTTAKVISDSLKFASDVSISQPVSGDYYKITMDGERLTISKYSEGGTLISQESYGSDITGLNFHTDGDSKIIHFDLALAAENQPFTLASSILLNNLTISGNTVNTGGEVSALYYQRDYTLASNTPDLPEEPNPGDDTPDPPEELEENVVPGTEDLIYYGSSEVMPSAGGSVSLDTGKFFEYIYADGSKQLFVFTTKRNEWVDQSIIDNGPPKIGNYYITPFSGNVVSFDNGAVPYVNDGDICEYNGNYYICTNGGGTWVGHPPNEQNWFLLE